MQISNILSQVDLGAMALPEFQRGYVWNRDQVRELITSLYHRYPVGSLLVWSTRTDQANARGDASLQPGYVDLILDGQQRITSLYGVIRGRPPEFFQGNTQAFSGLYFNLASETFKFYSPLEMKADPALDRAGPPMPLPGSADEEELQAIAAFNIWVAELGLPQGEVLYELADAQTGAPLAIIDLAWPRGLQEGLSQPVALLLNEAEEIEEIVNQAGYRFFTNVEDLRAYVEQQVLSVPAVNTY